MSNNRKRVLKALTEAFLPLRDRPELRELVLDMPIGRPWTVEEATSIARRMWGSDATTLIGWCGITANCENEMTEYRFWVEVFKRLKAEDCGGDGEEGACIGAASPTPPTSLIH